MEHRPRGSSSDAFPLSHGRSSWLQLFLISSVLSSLTRSGFRELLVSVSTHLLLHSPVTEVQLRDSLVFLKDHAPSGSQNGLLICSQCSFSGNANDQPTSLPSPCLHLTPPTATSYWSRLSCPTSIPDPARLSPRPTVLRSRLTYCLLTILPLLYLKSPLPPSELNSRQVKMDCWFSLTYTK